MTEKKKLTAKDGSAMKLDRGETAKLTVWLMGIHNDGKLKDLMITEVYDKAREFMGREFTARIIDDICKSMGWPWKKRMVGQRGAGKYSRMTAIMKRIDAIEELVTKPAGDSNKAVEIIREEMTTLKASVNKLREETNRLFGLLDSRLVVIEKKVGVAVGAVRPV